jgi:hypothetical protein
MFSERRVFRVLLAAVLLLAAALALPPGRADAETSYHKLKRHLRTVERKTGAALQELGESAGDVLSGVEIELTLGGDDDDRPTSHPLRQVSEKAPKPAAVKPAAKLTSLNGAPWFEGPAQNKFATAQVD